MYVKLPEKPTLYCDVDDTLLFADAKTPDQLRTGSNKVILNGRVWYAHPGHVDILKDFYARGHHVVVWSAGGSDWAEAVVRALELTEWVTLVAPKPTWMIDDRRIGDFTDREGRRFYLDPKPKCYTPD